MQLRDRFTFTDKPADEYLPWYGHIADDLVLLYFSCHGLTTAARRLYFAASNTMQDRPAGTAIPRSFLNEQLAELGGLARGAQPIGQAGLFVEGDLGNGTKFNYGFEEVPDEEEGRGQAETDPHRAGQGRVHRRAEAERHGDRGR